ncbi:hypothetical protein [Acidovorax delafieldii]|uniref:hypothetical protein n=1 Tax=Acidovorax delafieldii TaxID=47920 RepID=UPI003B27BFBF
MQGRPERIKIGRYSDVTIEQARKEDIEKFERHINTDRYGVRRGTSLQIIRKVEPQGPGVNQGLRLLNGGSGSQRHGRSHGGHAQDRRAARSQPSPLD